MMVVLVLAMAVSASVRTGGSGHGSPWPSRGSYTIVNMIAGGLTTSYGLAIQTSVSNSMWILNWGDMMNYEFTMDTGDPTGSSWAITGGVDPDDQAFCEFASGNQFFMTDYTASFFAVFDEDGNFLRNIDGPPGYQKLFGIGVGHDMVYLGGASDSKLAWGGPYTGTETSIASWDDMDYTSVYGLAVWENYLFVALGIEASPNILIHEIAADGTPSADPVWSTIFFENPANGGIDYDGEYLYLYPQNDYVYILDIDFDPQALEQTTWGSIKAGL